MHLLRHILTKGGEKKRSNAAHTINTGTIPHPLGATLGPTLVPRTHD